MEEADGMCAELNRRAAFMAKRCGLRPYIKPRMSPTCQFPWSCLDGAKDHLNGNKMSDNSTTWQSVSRDTVAGDTISSSEVDGW